MSQYLSFRKITLNIAGQGASFSSNASCKEPLVKTAQKPARDQTLHDGLDMLSVEAPSHEAADSKRQQNRQHLTWLRWPPQQ
jgi:hypothetical protein